MILRWVCNFAVVCGFVVASAQGARAAELAGKVDFSRDIQPILSDNCYFCHGPDSGKRKGDLRLDRLDPKMGPFVPRDGYFIIKPGKVDESTLADRIVSDDPDVKMPPPASHRELTAAQIQLMQRWIEQGAKWGKLWSLIPPVRPELPAVKDASWPRNPMDAFILAKLEREGLAPSPMADKATLIRRVTLDLTGLPPTLAEIDAFVADASSDAYEKVVDRLMNSPRYGERMVWEWLDLARYADTNGYQGDATRTMWPWRDWCVNAMNANMPYDQFVIKQLAGDLLPDATQDDKIATAFLRNHMINGEGGRIAEENRVDYVMDQSETFSTAFLGMTVGCARCHDHKYDPISQKDYYSLFAFFNNTPVTGDIGGGGQVAPVVDVATADEKKALAETNAVILQRAGIVMEIERGVFPEAEATTKPASTAPSTTSPTAQAAKAQAKTTNVATTSHVAPTAQAATSQTAHATTKNAPARRRANEEYFAASSPRIAQLSGNVVASLRQFPQHRAPQYLNELAEHFKKSEPKYAEALTSLRQAMESRQAAADRVPKVMVEQELPTPRDAFVLVKGSYDKHADKVTANTPTTLPAIPSSEKKDRLALAKWLFTADHPLTARVAVNHQWQQFFGVGLVKTAEDFGSQGERPSDQPLLDWLAVEFRESGWNVKALQRLIVTSAAYRQSSKVTPALFERDPQDRLLARAPRYRWPAFMIRDQALAASGLLVEHLGGAPVKPYQPAGVWEDATFGQIKYVQDHGDSLYRRSLYTFWRRIVGPTEFFDNATRETCTVRTVRTNTPMHAFTTLNDPTFVEAARTLAQRVMTTAGASPEKRAAMAFRLVLGRLPEPAEQDVLVAALGRLQKQYAADPAAAKKLVSVGESKRDESLDPVAHAAYTSLCLEILNLDEALTKE